MAWKKESKSKSAYGCSYLPSSNMWPNQCLDSDRQGEDSWEHVKLSSYIRKDAAHFKSQKHLFLLKWQLLGCKNVCFSAVLGLLSSVPFLSLPLLCHISGGWFCRLWFPGSYDNWIWASSGQWEVLRVDWSTDEERSLSSSCGFS